MNQKNYGIKTIRAPNYANIMQIQMTMSELLDFVRQSPKAQIYLVISYARLAEFPYSKISKIFCPANHLNFDKLKS